MVRMLVEVVWIIGDDHLRPITFDELSDPAGSRLDGHVTKRLLTALKVRHAGVVVTEQFKVRDTEARAGTAELILPDGCHLAGDHDRIRPA